SATEARLVSVIAAVVPLRPERKRVSRRTSGKAAANHVFLQIATNEHDPALALLVVLPGPLMIAIQDHVHALEHETLRVVLEREDTLRSQDVGTFGRDQVLHPGKELVGIEWPLALERERLHLLVVIVL